MVIFDVQIRKNATLCHSVIVSPCYSSRLWRRNAQVMPETTTEMIRAMMNPNGAASMPLMRFIPNIEVTSVGIIRMMVTDVSVRITVFMLLLMMLE